MIASGTILHAITSLKSNRREHYNFAAKDFKSSISSRPLVFRKKSKEVCKNAAKRVQLLKTRENIRLGLVTIVISNLITTLLIFFL